MPTADIIVYSSPLIFKQVYVQNLFLISCNKVPSYPRKKSKTLCNSCQTRSNVTKKTLLRKNIKPTLQLAVFYILLSSRHQRESKRSFCRVPPRRRAGIASLISAQTRSPSAVSNAAIASEIIEELFIQGHIESGYHFHLVLFVNTRR